MHELRIRLGSESRHTMTRKRVEHLDQGGVSVAPHRQQSSVSRICVPPVPRSFAIASEHLVRRPVEDMETAAEVHRDGATPRQPVEPCRLELTERPRLSADRCRLRRCELDQRAVAQPTCPGRVARVPREPGRANQSLRIGAKALPGLEVARERPDSLARPLFFQRSVVHGEHRVLVAAGFFEASQVIQRAASGFAQGR